MDKLSKEGDLEHPESSVLTSVSSPSYYDQVLTLLVSHFVMIDFYLVLVTAKICSLVLVCKTITLSYR